MSKINITGIVRDIKSKTTYLTPLIEAVCNSIDAIKGHSGGMIEISVIRDGQISIGDKENKALGNIIAVDVKDNGVGFNQDNRESFDTYRSGFKFVAGGKGFGRFMYLKYFAKVSIESIYQENNIYSKRTFTFGHQNEIIENEEIVLLEGNEYETGTILHLSSVYPNKFIDKGLEVIARKLVERLLVFFVDKDTNVPIIVLKENDESNSIVINQYIDDEIDILVIGEKPMTVKSSKSGIVYDFKVKVYKILYSPITSKICLTANSREVTDSSIHNYVPEFKETLFDLVDNTQKNYTVKAYVIGKYLDDNVTVERDGFNIAKDDSDLYSDLSISCIERGAAHIVKVFFVESISLRFAEKKRTVYDYVFTKAPWNKTLLTDIDLEKMPMGISESELEMHFQKMKFEKEQRNRIAIEDILNHQENENDDNFGEQVNQIFQSISDAGKNDLAHYVCNRKKVIDLFDNLRRRTEVGKAHLECEVHNLIFPMINNDRNIEYDNHNLWLLDERLVFSQYVASDKVISKVEHDEPDLAVFFKERMFYRNGDNIITSPITIFEFKRPKRTNYPDDENPITQACRYAKKILENKYEMPDGLEPIKVNKDNTPVYIYIVCDIAPKIREFADNASLTVCPDDEGYFGYIKAYNAYVEIMSFRKLIDDAKMRNLIFFKKLGLE